MSYYPYQKISRYEIEDIRKNINTSTIDALKEIILLKKETEHRSGYSVEFMVRIQTMMSLYSQHASFRHSMCCIPWRLDRLLWAYSSLIQLSNKDIISLYVYQRIYPMSLKIYEYSQQVYNKNINKLTHEELIELYTAGK